MAISPLMERAPEMIYGTGPSHQARADPVDPALVSGNAVSHQGANNGKSGNWNGAGTENADVIRQSKKEILITEDTSDLLPGIVDNDSRLAGAYYVTSDGHRVMREKASLTAHPNAEPLSPKANQQSSGSPTSFEQDAASKAEGTKPNHFIYSMKCKVLVLIAFLVCAVVIGVAVPLSQKGGTSSSSPTMNINAQRQQTVASLLQNVSASEALANTSSPQYEAFDWIVQTDQLTPITNTSSIQAIQKLLTRYALATFYYSLDGDNWVARNGWLAGGQDECAWQFVTCNNDMVQSILMPSNNLMGGVPPEVQLLASLGT
jgi:hypothetical protein